MTRTSRKRLAVLLGLMSILPVWAVTAVPFEHAVGDAPFVLLVRYEEGSSPKFRVLTTFKGNPGTGEIPVNRPEWFYRPLAHGGEYLVLLASDLRPFVGRLTNDESPEDQVPAYGCGTVNVLRVMDGYVHDFYEFVRGRKGRQMTPEEYIDHLEIEAGTAG